MKTKDIKKGISLIVLIITIIVVIILAAVVILTLSKNNPIESAKEARFKEDVRTFQDELALYISKQYANAGGHWDGNISAKSYNQIVEYIPSFTKKYEGKFIINNNNLEYTNELDEKEKEYAQNLNVKEKIKVLPDEFKQVEYIKSTGTQYINTRVFSKTEKYKVIYDMKVSEEAYGFIGANGILQLLLNRGKYYINATNGTAISTTDRHTVISEGEITNSNTNTKLTIEDKTISQTWNEVAYGNILLFALGDKQNIYQNNKVGNIYMYSCKIIENNILIRNFIPCKSITTVTNADGKTVPANTKGLCDTVEGKFYTNQGTGEDFIPGPDVN